ncbi:MAG TPA: hypothetical protein VFJ14_11120 [Nocardioidaceae bacterium]|nr:hypothetical protein [Nocardioidaceae bacterium]
MADGTDRADPGGRLDDAEVEDLLTRFERLLGRVEQVPGPTADAALEAIETLAAVYGEALARVMSRVAALAEPGLAEQLVEDELVGHLLVLHGLHPQSVEDRVAETLAEVGTLLQGDDGVELTGIDAGVARIRVTASGCGSAGLGASVADAVLAAAPELAEVVPETVQPLAAAPLIPAESLLRRPGAAR